MKNIQVIFKQMKENIDISKLNDDGLCSHLINKKIPNISLPNQDGTYLKLNRSDTFRLVVYFYSLTGNPEKKLPENWNKIPGAKGCTLQNCSFRDNYEKIIEMNAIPIGVSTQSIEYIKEMTSRLMINYDVLSDLDLILIKALKLPTFSINKQVYLKKFTLIIHDNTIKKVFYPINSIEKHISEVIKWLKTN